MLTWLLGTYLLAAVPYGLVLTTLFGGETDLRASGSGNIGATNVARTHGWKLAVPALLLDMGKGALPVLGATLLWPEVWWLPATAGLVAFFAHCWPVYLEFHGGKGVATAAGVMLVLAPWPALGAVGVWLALLGATGRSSVAALTATVALVGLVAWLQPTLLLMAALLMAGIVIRHLTNIRRLVRGEEAAIVRPVRLGREAGQPMGAEVLEESPAGNKEASEAW